MKTFGEPDAILTLPISLPSESLCIRMSLIVKTDTILFGDQLCFVEENNHLLQERYTLMIISSTDIFKKKQVKFVFKRGDRRISVNPPRKANACPMDGKGIT